MTEQINPASANLDLLSPLEIVDLFNQEDQKTIKAISLAREEIAKTIEVTADRLGQGGDCSTLVLALAAVWGYWMLPNVLLPSVLPLPWYRLSSPVVKKL